MASAKKSLGKNCSAACVTKNHESFGACLRAKRLTLSPRINETYSTAQTAWDKELDSYEYARSQGVEPEGTKQSKIDAALKAAE